MLYGVLGVWIGYMLCALLSANKFDELQSEIHRLGQEKAKLQKQVDSFQRWLDKLGL